jgi:type I restriction-modification system DNA methylase subunit
MLPMTVLRRFDCVLAPTKAKVLAEHARRKGGKLEGDALDTNLNTAAGQRFHHHSPLDSEKLKGDPDNIEKHLVSYIKGFSKNLRDIFEFFEFENEIDRMRVRKVTIRGDARQNASTAEDSANSRSSFVLWRSECEVVGATGFEPATPCGQRRCLARRQ